MSQLRKFNLLISQIVLTSSIFMSGPSMASLVSELELYGGVSGGVDYFVPKREVDQATVGLPTIVSKTYDSKTAGIGNIFLGLLYQIDSFGLALELADQIGTAETESKTDNFLNNAGITASAKIKHLNTASIALLPSFKLSQSTNFFLRGGYAKGQFQVKSAGDTGGNLIATGNQRVWRSGYIAGVGIETCLVPAVSLRLEYDYSQFQSISGTSTLPVIYLGDTIHSKVTPKDGVVMLSLVFHAIPTWFY